MKLINPKAEVLIQPPGLDGIYKQIEIAGRTCYKSEDKITEASSVDFVKRMIESHHTAMLEHGTVYLKTYRDFEYEHNIELVENDNELTKYSMNPYSVYTEDNDYAYVTTNFRVMLENRWLEDLPLICEPTNLHKKRITIRFVTDRGVSHELVRHRKFSFAQESTRYCNYTKDKFGNAITFIIPTWASNKDEISYKHDPYDIEERGMFKADFGDSYGGLLHQLCLVEDEYFFQLQNGRTPQEARQILPNALKTEVIMTGYLSDWRHFFDLRYFGKTGKPHPDMEYLATLAKEALEKEGLWEEIMAQPSKFN